MAQSKHCITRHSCTPSDSILQPVKEQYGKGMHAMDQQVHVQKHATESNFCMKTVDESQRLHPYNTAASINVRQSNLVYMLAI